MASNYSLKMIGNAVAVNKLIKAAYRILSGR